MPKKSYNNCFEIGKGNVGEELDRAMLKFCHAGTKLPRELSGASNLFNMDTNEPLDHDISIEDLSKGNYAFITPYGKVAKLNLVVSDRGTLYGNFDYSANVGPKKPSLGERVKNFFRKKENKSPEVQKWNRWKEYLKTAEKRSEFVKKSMESHFYEEPVDGYSLQEYRTEVEGPQRRAKEASEKAEMIRQANETMLETARDLAINGTLGPAMKACGEKNRELRDAVEYNRYYKAESVFSPVERIRASVDYVENTMFLHLSSNNKQLQERLAKNDGDVHATMGRDFEMNLSKVLKKMGLDEAVSDCLNNGGMKVLEEMKSLAKQKDVQPNVDKQKNKDVSAVKEDSAVKNDGFQLGGK